MNINPDDIQGSLRYSDSAIWCSRSKAKMMCVEMSPVQIKRLHDDRNSYGVWDYHSVERFAMFCAACAGKNSHQQSEKLDMFEEFLRRSFGQDLGLFDIIRQADDEQILMAMRYSALGKYNLLLPGFKAMARDDSFPGEMGDRRDKVAKYSGYGIKTASLFNMHIFHEECACLDTYILRWLAGDAMFHDAPIEARPPSYKNVPRQSISNWDIYERWEDAFLSTCYKRGLKALQLDKLIWVHARIKTEKPKVKQGELNYA